MFTLYPRFIVSFALLIFAYSGMAQGQYDLRFFIHELDMANAKLYVDVEIRADALTSEFYVSDMNFRFSIGNGLSNPQIEEELTLSGLTQTTSPPSNSFYEPHTLTGSADTVVSYNVVIGGGDGYPLNNIAYVKVGRLSFDIVNPSACMFLTWHSHDPNDFPPTFVGELNNGTYQSALEGPYNDYIQCDIPTFNHAPNLLADMASTEAETPVSACILDNDFDIDSELDLSTLVLTTVPPTSQGVAVLNPVTNCVDFTPAVGFSGFVDQIVYQLCDDGYNIPATLGADNGEMPSDPVPADEVVQVYASKCTSGTLNIEVTDSRINVATFVMLQGPYNAGSGIMSTDLNTNGYIPLTEPYTALGRHTGSEMTTPAVLAANPVVDWVLVELRDKNDLSIIIESKAGLLLQNGEIRDVNGVDNLPFAAAFDSYFVAIRHRSHIGVVTKNPIALGTGNTVVDFTTLPIYGPGAVNTSNGINLLWCGDGNADGGVDAIDRSETWNNRNQIGYLLPDVNIDGSVDAIDRSITWNNRNKSEQLQ